MSTPAELLAQSLAKLRNANRIDGTRASYRKDNPGEFVSVMAYLDGGPRPGNVTSDMGMGLMLEEDARRALVPAPPPPPPPPPPGTGTLRAHFTDFYTHWEAGPSDHNGQIFQNRWNLGPGLQTLLRPQTPWASTGGAAIYEVLDEEGIPGFRFLANPEMHSDSGSKKVEIYENGNEYGTPMARGLGFIDETAFKIRCPNLGNPNGFPGPAEGVYDRRNVFWQNSMDGANKLHLLGISRLGNTNRFYCSVLRDSVAQTERLGVTLPWEVELEKSYGFRRVIKWASDSTGFLKLWVKRPSDPSEVLVVDYSGVTWGSAPNTEFGFYTAAALKNEVVISDIRVTPH